MAVNNRNNQQRKVKKGLGKGNSNRTYALERFTADSFSDVYKSVLYASEGLQESADLGSSSQFIESLKGLPFYRWDGKHNFTEPQKCCFNCRLGWPRKGDVKLPLFDYEESIFAELMLQTGEQTDKHVWIKKATGLGVTELILRIMVWLATKDDALRGSEMTIIVGPRIDLAINSIKRIKDLFIETPVLFDTASTVVTINDVTIQAYPSHHLDSARGLPNVSFIFSDESAFFPLHEQENVRDVMERYIGKSNPYIVQCSTPNTPWDTFALIESEP